MKNIFIRLLVVTSVACATRAMAQQAEAGTPPPVAPPSNDASNQPPHARGFRHGGGAADGEYIDKWLDSLKQRNPAEFERMKKLRDDNPEEFRKQVHQKWQDLRMKSGGLREHPQVVEAFKNLSPSDREWVMQRLTQPAPGENFPGGGSMGFDRGGFGDFKHATTPEIAKADAKARDLAKQYREAQNGDAKNAMKKELRDTLANVFDLREKVRVDQLKQIEDKVEKIRKQIGESKSKRDEIIDGRVKEFISGESKPRS